MDEERSSVFQYRPLVRATCQKVLREYPSWVDDAVQETYEKYFWAIKDGKVIDNVAGWLVRVAQTTSIDIIRTMVSPLSSSSDEHSNSYFSDNGHFVFSLEKKMEFKIAAHLLMAFLPKDEKGKRQRKIIEQAVAGNSRQEIARFLAITEQLLSKDIKEIRQTVLRTEACYQKLVSHLSERQREILRHAKEGKRVEEIAKALDISPSTISQEKKTISEILKKLFDGPWDDGGGGAGSGLFGRKSTKGGTGKGAGSSLATGNVFRAFLGISLFQQDPIPHAASVVLTQQKSSQFSKLWRGVYALLSLSIFIYSPKFVTNKIISFGRESIQMLRFIPYMVRGFINEYLFYGSAPSFMNGSYTTISGQNRAMELIAHNARSMVVHCIDAVTSFIQGINQTIKDWHVGTIGFINEEPRSFLRSLNSTEPRKRSKLWDIALAANNFVTNVLAGTYFVTDSIRAERKRSASRKGRRTELSTIPSMLPHMLYGSINTALFAFKDVWTVIASAASVSKRRRFQHGLTASLAVNRWVGYTDTSRSSLISELGPLQNGKTSVQSNTLPEQVVSQTVTRLVLVHNIFAPMQGSDRNGDSSADVVGNSLSYLEILRLQQEVAEYALAHRQGVDIPGWALIFHESDWKERPDGGLHQSITKLPVCSLELKGKITEEEWLIAQESEVLRSLERRVGY